MRALHLSTVLPEGTSLRVDGGGLLVIPGWIPREDHAPIVDIYQRCVARASRRVDVDWFTRLEGTSRVFLERLLGSRKIHDTVLVVSVGTPDALLDEVLDDPTIRAFPHRVVSNQPPGGGEPLRALLSMTRAVVDRTRSSYVALVEELGLPDMWTSIDAVLDACENPLDVIEAANGLIHLQLLREVFEPRDDLSLLEYVRSDVPHKARALRRLLRDMTPHELIALVALAATGEGDTQRWLANWTEIALRSLERRELYGDGRLLKWARWLQEKPLWPVLGQVIREVALLPFDWTPITTRVLKVMDVTALPVSNALSVISEAITANENERADELFQMLDRREDVPRDATYLSLRAQVSFRLGRDDEAAQAAKTAVELIGDAPEEPQKRELLVECMRIGGATAYRHTRWPDVRHWYDRVFAAEERWHISHARAFEAIGGLEFVARWIDKNPWEAKTFLERRVSICSACGVADHLANATKELETFRERLRRSRENLLELRKMLAGIPNPTDTLRAQALNLIRAYESDLGLQPDEEPPFAI